MKHNSLRTRFFNFRLFMEGFKRLRVVGAVTGVIALVASILNPVIQWIEFSQHPYEVAYIATIVREEIPNYLLAAPAGYVALLAPIFFLVLFSFLRKRKESDFFHAIPYTRTCVYVSFVSAAIAFVAAIQILCAAVSAVIWAMCPYAICDLWSLVPYTLLCILAAAMLSAFMMLALTVSGTGGATVVLFFLFVSLVRIICAVWLTMVDTVYIVNAETLWSSSVLSPMWFLPLSMLFYSTGAVDMGEHIIFSPGCIIYSMVVTLALYAFAGFLYCRRKSEMAGNPAPGKRTQTLFRILFTLPSATLFVAFAVTESWDLSLFLVMSAIILLCYFLYELCTTKRAKNLVKAIPTFSIVIAFCIVLGVGFWGYENVVRNENIEADEIRSVTFNSAIYTSRYTYQSTLSADIRVTDKEVREMVAEAFAETQSVNGHNYAGNYTQFEMDIRMKDGRTLSRYVLVTKSLEGKLIDRLKELDEFSDIRHALPKEDEIDRVYYILPFDNDDYNYRNKRNEELYRIFCEEFATLTDQQKDRVMFHNLPRYEKTQNAIDEYYADRVITLSVSGELMRSTSYGGNVKDEYHATYCITDDLPRTHAYILSLWNASTNGHLRHISSDIIGNGTSAQVLKHVLEDPKLGYLENSTKHTLTMKLYNNKEDICYQNDYLGRDVTLSGKKLVEVLRFVQAHQVAPEDGAAYSISENSYCLCIDTSSYKDSRVYATLNILLDLTPDEKATLLRLLGKND